ncbi:hypothetical protein V6259_12890 [Marinomonas sp. TI.3.20]|uniref:hypothetical protein n=1 Tax=Marinomonas sp. TI.3.20 TaxID=3121296 RepID=UPI00311D872B
MSNSPLFKSINFTGSITESRLTNFDSVLYSLNKKLAARNLAPLAVSKSSEGLFCWFKQGNAINVKKADKCTQEEFDAALLIEPKYTISISGTLPAFKGFEYIGRTNFTDHSTPLFYGMPGVDSSTFGFDLSENCCDHCHTHRDRHELIIVRNEQGEMLRVGTSCMDDYLGDAGAEKLFNDLYLLVSDFDSDPEDDQFSGSSVPAYVDLKRFLTLTFAFCAVNGYVSKSKATDEGQVATSNILSGIYFSTSSDLLLFLERGRAFSEQIDDTIAHFKEVEPTNDYLTVMKAIATDGFATVKELGYAASMYSFYQRDQEKTPRLNEHRTEPIGQRVKGVILKNVYQTTNHHPIFGINFYTLAIDEEGRTITFHSSKPLGTTAPYLADFTIKDYKTDDAKGEHKTVVTRVSHTRAKGISDFENISQDMTLYYATAAQLDVDLTGFEELIVAKQFAKLLMDIPFYADILDYYYNKKTKQAVYFQHCDSTLAPVEMQSAYIMELSTPEALKLHKAIVKAAKLIDISFQTEQAHVTRP